MSINSKTQSSALEGQNPHTDFRESMSYGQYLALDQLLNIQKRRSDTHDEMLFIIIHQATELWMKLIIFEMQAAVADLRDDNLSSSFKRLARISRIQEQLLQSWSVLSTMTPADYMTFRHTLGHASGFQSHQYRTIEFMMGNKQRAMLKPFEHDAATHEALKKVLESPSLYDEVILLLARRGFELPEELLERDWSQRHQSSDALLAVWKTAYQDTETHWDVYELGEELVDLEDAFQTWRFRHLTTVERVIGFKKGTGGTSGASYLRRALEIRFFPELWDVRTAL